MVKRLDHRIGVISQRPLKGFMLLNGPTYYIDSYSGGDVGEPFIGRVRIGNQLLTEEQLVGLAERYVDQNSYKIKVIE
jgi:hypothetical protein